MAIGSVKELIDYERETIKIAKKHGGGGGSVDLSLIADEYNPDRTTPYEVHDMVVYEGKLYKSRSKVPPAIGEFDSDMWDLAANEYDSTQTYNEYDLATHEGLIYRCDETNVTGEWDSSHWSDISHEYNNYNSNARYPNLSYPLKVKYDGNYYHNNENLDYTGTMGDFGSAYWAETTVEELINAVTPKQSGIYQFTTDSEGCVWIEGRIEPFNLILSHDGAFSGYTGRIEIVHKYENSKDYVGFKFYDGEGNVRTNWNSFSDLGMSAAVIYKYYQL